MSVILSISENVSLNYLVGTVLSPKYQIVSAKNVYEAVDIVRGKSNIHFIIIDLDYNTKESFDFISHINTSSLYKMHIIALYSSKYVHLEDRIRGGCYRCFEKPFNPLHMLQTIDGYYKNLIIA